MSNPYVLTTKKIYDPIHGFIHFDEIEKAFIDSEAFQRLHYIHQLGYAFLVYPGATHKRFQHSLGTMVLAAKIYERICQGVRPDQFQYIPRKNSIEYSYWKKILRIAALSHDLGHSPFSHAAEQEFLKEEGHEAWTLKILESHYFDSIWEMLQESPIYKTIAAKRNPQEDVAKIALGEKKMGELRPDLIFNSWERVLSQVICGDFFGADRMDYLLRDARYSGIAYGLFDYLQLIEMLRILPGAEEDAAEMELGIEENGIESCEALILARHFMHKRVYGYRSVRGYNFHLRRFVRNTYKKPPFSNIKEFIHFNDIDVMHQLKQAYAQLKHPGHEDAKVLMLRKDHFKAITISPHISEDFLNDFKKKNGVNLKEMEWDAIAEEDTFDLSFPVSRKNFFWTRPKTFLPYSVK